MSKTLSPVQFQALQGLVRSMKHILKDYQNGLTNEEITANNLNFVSNKMKLVRQGNRDAINLGLWRSFNTGLINKETYALYRSKTDLTFNKLR